MKRGGPIERRPGKLKRTPLRRFGARHKRDGTALSRFIRLVMRRAYVAALDGHRCERCGIFVPAAKNARGHWRVRAHHIVPRARAPGWSGLHDPSNGAALCTRLGSRIGCHERVHDLVASDWERWLREGP